MPPEPALPWLWIGKPLRAPLRDGSTVLAADLARVMPEDVDLAYLGDPAAPLRSRDTVLPAPAMGYAPTLAAKLRVLGTLLRPRHAGRGVHFFFTPNRVTSTVVRLLRLAQPRRLMIQSVMSSHGARGFGPLLRPMDHVITLSHHTRRVLVEEAGLAADRVTCVHPGVALPREVAPMPATPAALYAGDLDPKVVGLLVQIGRALPPGARLVIAARPKGEGDPACRARLRRELAEPLGCGRVELHAEVEDMGRLMDRCSLQVFLADHLRRKVDLPLALLEGLARGRGLLCSELPSLGEIFAPGADEAGGVLPPERLPGRVVSALADPGLLARWGAAARQLAATRFDRARMGREVAQIYRTCARR